jgi:hypothetical protein
LGTRKNLKAEIALGSKEAQTFSQGLKEGARGLQDLQAGFAGGTAGLLGGVGAGLSGKGLAIAGTVAALGELYHLASEAGRHAHEVDSLSEALGVSTGQVRAWMLAAKLAGVDTESYAQTLERTAISADKAYEAQRKLVLEGASLSAKGPGFGGVFRGGMNTPEPPQTSKTLDYTASFIKQTPELEEAVLHQYEALEKMRVEQIKMGQTPQNLPTWEAYYAGVRKELAGTDKAAEEMRQTIRKVSDVQLPFRRVVFQFECNRSSAALSPNCRTWRRKCVGCARSHLFRAANSAQSVEWNGSQRSLFILNDCGREWRALSPSRKSRRADVHAPVEQTQMTACLGTSSLAISRIPLLQRPILTALQRRKRPNTMQSILWE